MPSFPKIQSLRGELKRTEIRGMTRCQLTTREVVVQRPQRTYRISLDNIIGVLECEEDEYRQSHGSKPYGDSGRPYKIVTTLLYLISPAGVIEQTSVTFYTRFSRAFATQLERLLHA